MKIASYNIWNSDRDYKQRLEMLTKVIGELDLDIIALQEVRNNDVIQYVLSETGLKYFCWQPYPDCEEGLAILSKYPIAYNWKICKGL
jgi:endonuclease/exonuclease/phosphatase family metal-dependent hydrolase